MKKLLLLGGSHDSIALIKKAHDLGCQIICCDMDEHAPAVQYSDYFYNVSVTKKEIILQIARDNNIDGILSFACDAGVVTASYIANVLGLVYNGPDSSVKILQDKGLFRQFLLNNGFNCPHAKRYTDCNEPFNDLDYYNWPVIVKPVDSAGSRGVRRVDKKEDLADAIENAMKYSLSKAFIMEDYLIFEGYHSDADIFVNNGTISFITYSDQIFDPEAINPYAITTVVWPSSMKDDNQKYLTRELQRLISLLDMKTGLYNVETCVDNQGRPYIMEVSPRGGGQRIAEIQSAAFGLDLLDAEIKSALGLKVPNFGEHSCNGCWCKYCIHLSNKKGILKSVSVADKILNEYVYDFDLHKKKGDEIMPYYGAGNSIGDLIMCFKSRSEYEQVMSKINNWMTIDYEEKS